MTLNEPHLQLDHCLTCTIIVIFRTIFQLCHSHLAWRQPYTWHICLCSFRWPWPWCKVTVGRQKINFELSRQLRNLKLATTVGHFFTWPWLWRHLYGLVTFLFLLLKTYENSIRLFHMCIISCRLWLMKCRHTLFIISCRLWPWNVVTRCLSFHADCD